MDACRGEERQCRKGSSIQSQTREVQVRGMVHRRVPRLNCLHRTVHFHQSHALVQTAVNNSTVSSHIGFLLTTAPTSFICTSTILQYISFHSFKKIGMQSSMTKTPTLFFFLSPQALSYSAKDTHRRTREEKKQSRVRGATSLRNNRNIATKKISLTQMLLI